MFEHYFYNIITKIFTFSKYATLQFYKLECISIINHESVNIFYNNVKVEIRN